MACNSAFAKKEILPKSEIKNWKLEQKWSDCEGFYSPEVREKNNKDG